MSADLDDVLAKLLEGHSRVGPRAEDVRRWMERREQPLPRRWWGMLRPEGGLAPAWAVLAAAMLLAIGLAIGLAWNKLQARSAQPQLATEHTVIAPLKNAPPLTEEQKKLIQLLATNPGALATKQPGDLDKPAKKKAPGVPHR
jgi:hypothetical protein